MTISDYTAFLPNKRAITLTLSNGATRTFTVALNIPVGLFNRMISSLLSMENSNDLMVQLEMISELTVELLQPYHPNITQEWVLNNIKGITQKELIEAVYKEIQTIIQSDCFSIPKIEVKKEEKELPKDSKARDDYKKRKAKRDKIKKYEDTLKNYRAYNLIDDIAILSMKTNNSFSEIQAMPIFVFRDMVRAVIIGEMRTDEDYNLAYLEYEMKKYNAELKKDLPHYVPPERKRKKQVEAANAPVNQDDNKNI